MPDFSEASPTPRMPAEEAEKEAGRAKESKKGKKKKKKGKGGGGGAGPSQGLSEDEAALAAAEEAEAAALEESARLDVGATRAAGGQARVAERQGDSSPAEEAPPEGEEEPPDDFICPITTEVMSDPVMAADGQSYERTAIERWLATKSTSPLTGGALEHPYLTPNHMLRRMIRDWEGARKAALIRPGYATIEVDLKHEKAAGDRESLRENIQYVMAGLRSAAAQARSQAGSKIGVEYSLPPERDDGYRRGPSKVYATVPQGTVATTVASDWLANELAEHGEIDAAYRDRIRSRINFAAPFTQRSLTSVWRTCPLLHEALPGAKQVLQWQRIDNVIASFDEATRVYMICPFARAMHKSGAEWKLWKNGGNQRETHGIGRLLRRMTKEMAEDPLIALDVARLQDVAASRDSDDELDQQPWLLSIDSRMDTSQFAQTEVCLRLVACIGSISAVGLVLASRVR
ncbi:hypothetical protein EMIHUDRAFT_107448 [Emiliania huxleyi CCMP1516]|uniref:U-box domain-containing protein n=2 Tax=Emiliania huxleyi TaxID=2903 RepID=A0A0D3I145_EMIH1|nr:hypothetical protein EMIHUDRAFT_107448 [Emiliania huxleyi CCMP1516]EOD04980.1 hypothetical protein EMIHUDRAFT_107448 [Emiliania huxleyi CCMP1516]|eukprot:XP_005757409.1 hypothetical protein EMIHUDRAFT_107448 [Emiliania huxleyi CCMP1516]